MCFCGISILLYSSIEGGFGLSLFLLFDFSSSPLSSMQFPKETLCEIFNSSIGCDIISSI